jgi:hypothetical protein
MTLTASADTMERARELRHACSTTTPPVRVRLLKPDRPRAIDRYIDYFGECGAPRLPHPGDARAGHERARHRPGPPHGRRAGSPAGVGRAVQPGSDHGAGREVVAR